MFILIHILWGFYRVVIKITLLRATLKNKIFSKLVIQCTITQHRLITSLISTFIQREKTINLSYNVQLHNIDRLHALFLHSVKEKRL